MRWDKPKHGEIRIKRKFLFFPTSIWYKVRWLEFVNIRQECVVYNHHTWWVNKAWVDEDE